MKVSNLLRKDSERTISLRGGLWCLVTTSFGVEECGLGIGRANDHAAQNSVSGERVVEGGVFES